jgi:hypothetical protein
LSFSLKNTKIDLTFELKLADSTDFFKIGVDDGLTKLEQIFNKETFTILTNLKSTNNKR